MASAIRRVGLAVALMAAIVSAPATAHAVDPAGSCTITPNPVPVGTPYAIDATGLTINTAFAVHIQATGTPPANVFATSDEFGNASTGSLPAPQRTGTATATWKKLQIWPSGYGPILTYGMAEAICDWTIIAA
jgi:hypothetical protein